ncbi:hypothetical protein TPR58_16445 [Sphingomonas sp. HF-S3]|uniref:Uncharacterized protein n=1 Tax=Sphingomonas rustica TaxID=3103142 RepID=A0ABV0BDP5_9SPHN
MIVGFLFIVQDVPQLPPPRLPLVPIENLTDSAGRQTLPAYKVDCKLNDSRGRISHLKLEQTGGRGVRGTKDELWTMPAWRGFVSTPVSLKIVKDDAGIFENSVVEAEASAKQSDLEIYRWDATRRSNYDTLMRFQDGETWVMIQLTETPEPSVNPSGPMVYGAVITLRRDNRNLPGAHLGFCSIKSSPQKPLSQAEEVEYRRR